MSLLNIVRAHFTADARAKRAEARAKRAADRQWERENPPPALR